MAVTRNVTIPMISMVSRLRGSFLWQRNVASVPQFCTDSLAEPHPQSEKSFFGKNAFADFEGTLSGGPTFRP